MAASHVALRKRVARRESKRSCRPVQWIGGVLYFTDRSTPQPVPYVVRIPKPGATATGLSAARPERQYRERKRVVHRPAPPPHRPWRAPRWDGDDW